MASTTAVLQHILKELFLMDEDDIQLLYKKRIRSVANLRRLSLSRLDRFLEDGAIFEGDYMELRLFLMYLKVHHPSNEEIMMMTHDTWADIDHEDIEQKYMAFTEEFDVGTHFTAMSTLTKPQPVRMKRKPLAPVLDEDDDITAPVDVDINAVVDTLWSGKFTSPIVPQCEAKDVHEDFVANHNVPIMTPDNTVFARIPPPSSGKELTKVLDETMGVIAKYSRRIQNTGHFGFIAASGVPTDPLSFAMTAAVNTNVATYASSPVMATMERTVISWLCQMIGFDERGDGCLLSGGSTSNLTAVGAAMAHRFGPKYREKGLKNMLEPGEQPVVICTGATHFCIQRAAGMLGIGVDNVIPIEGDDQFNMRIDLLKEALDQNPCVVCVVANAGSTTTGAIDPIDEIADLCAERNIWFHVDAAYGGSALMSPELKPLFKGIERADSVTMDLHKWFFMSYDCSAIVYKDPYVVKTLFDEQSDVVKQLSLDTFSKSHLFFHLGPELSRRARALPVYIAFQHYGMERLGRNVLYHVKCAKYLAECVEYDPNFELVSAPLLSICTFRMVPQGLIMNSEESYGEEKKNEEYLDETKLIDDLNQSIVDRIEKEGEFFISPTRVKGRPVLRLCIVNLYSRAKDIDDLLVTINRFGKEWIEENVPSKMIKPATGAM